MKGESLFLAFNISGEDIKVPMVMRAGISGGVGEISAETFAGGGFDDFLGGIGVILLESVFCCFGEGWVITEDMTVSWSGGAVVGAVV